jgi:hypothetical protein
MAKKGRLIGDIFMGKFPGRPYEFNGMATKLGRDVRKAALRGNIERVLPAQAIRQINEALVDVLGTQKLAGIAKGGREYLNAKTAQDKSQLSQEETTTVGDHRVSKAVPYGQWDPGYGQRAVFGDWQDKLADRDIRALRDLGIAPLDWPAPELPRFAAPYDLQPYSIGPERQWDEFGPLPVMPDYQTPPSFDERWGLGLPGSDGPRA